jgi:methyl-accepting chemotaxis protein
MKVSRMKLGTTLGLAFASMLLMTLVLGAVALQRTASIRDASEDMATNWLPSIKELAEVRNLANRIRRAESDHLISRTDADREKIGKQIEELKPELEKHIKAYAPMATPAEVPGLQEVERRKNAWLAVQPTLLKLSSGGARTADQARELLRGESRTEFEAMAKAISGLVQLNNDGSAASVGAARTAYASAKFWTLAICASALLAACVMGFLIVRSVKRLLGCEPGEAAALAQRVADGDLSAPIALRPGDTQSLMAAMKRMQESLTRIVSGVRNNADGVAVASAQIAQGNNDLSSRTEEQASALQQTAASMKQLAGTVRQNADNAAQGNQLAQEASTVAMRGGDVVHQVVETMKGINDSSRKIADIIAVIDGIAFQTNILALNAAVEAARAGEQGRGFAVVADEVRSLAQRCADAAKEIKGLITASVEQVEQGSALVDQAGATMNEVVDSIRRVTELMGEISSATTQQSAGVAQIDQAVNQMDQTTQQNAALVEQSAAAADSLKAQATQLVSAVSVFKVTEGAAPAANMASMVPVRPATTAGTPVPAPASKAQPLPALHRPAPAVERTGTNDEWTTF